MSQLTYQVTLVCFEWGVKEEIVLSLVWTEIHAALPFGVYESATSMNGQLSGIKICSTAPRQALRVCDNTNH